MRAIAFALLAIWCEYASENEPEGSLPRLALAHLSGYAAIAAFVFILTGW